MLKSAARIFTSLFGNPAVGGKVFHPTKTCPECGSKLYAEEGNDPKNWLCPNLDCPAQIRAHLEHWCSPAAMDIAGGDAALVAKLVAHGLARDVTELYRLKPRELAALPGMDKDSAQKFFEAISTSLKRDAWRLLFGLRIPGLSADAAQSLCRHFKLVDTVFSASAERLMQAEGVSAEAARSIVQWHSDGVNRKLVRRLFKAGLNFRADR